jgi:DNA polymerase III subunit delta
MAASNISPLDELERSIRKKSFSPLYYFYGDEDFLLQETVDAIVAHALDASEKSFNFDVVNGYDADAKEIVSIASAFPMMAERRVVIVKDFERVGNKDLMIPFFNDPLPSTVLVMIGEKKLDSRTKLAKALGRFAVIMEFQPLKDYKIPAWINSHVAKRKKEITGEACGLLHAHVGNSLREIHNEIDKLFIYIGEKQSIDLDDIDQVVGISKRYNIFELQNAIGAKNISRAQDIMERMIDAGEYPVGMITMLTKYFQKMWSMWDLLERKITRDELIKFLHLSPQQVQFLDRDLQTARSFPLGQIEHCFSVLQETDEKLKSSSQDERLLLTLMLHEIIPRGDHDRK